MICDFGFVTDFWVSSGFVIWAGAREPGSGEKTRLLNGPGSGNGGGHVGQVWASKNLTRTWLVAIPILKLQQKSKSQFTQTLPHILP